MKQLVFVLCLLCSFVTAPINPISERDRHNNYLMNACYRYNLDYDIMLAVRKAESKNNPECKETKNGVVISRGYFQISLATAKNYFWESGIDAPKDDQLRILCYDPYFNTDVACWSIRKYLDIHKGDYKAALSCHNMGVKGFLKYRKRTGLKYRWQYINWVKENGAKLL